MRRLKSGDVFRRLGDAPDPSCGAPCALCELLCCAPERALTFCASACTARIAYRRHVPRPRTSGGMGRVARRLRPPTPWCRACSRKRRY